MTIERVDPEPDKPIPSGRGHEGHGECIKWSSGRYYYRVGCYIPKDKAVSLVQESGYMGRQNGDKDWIIVAWNGENFSVLEHVFYHGIKKELDKYKGMAAEEAIAHKEALEAEREAEHERIMAKCPKCSNCGEPYIKLDSDDDECGKCRKGSGESK